MLPGGSDATYRAAIARPYTLYSRVDVTDYLGNVLLSDLPVSSGSVQVTLAQRVTRSLQLTTHRDYFPLDRFGEVNPSAALFPFGNRIKVYRGVAYGDGSAAVFPIFTGRVDDVEMERSGAVSIAASDLTAEVVDAAFEVPTPSNSGAAVTDEIRRLITGALPNATYGAFDADGHVVPSVVWTNDRGKALDDLTSGAGGLWYSLATGDFVFRKVPWTASGKTPVATLSDGLGGLLVDYKLRMTRLGVNNSVVAIAERQDASTPLYTASRDLDSTSATYYRGPFGKKPITLQVQTPTTLAQLQALADTRLAMAKAIRVTFSKCQILPDPSLEIGDLVSVTTESTNDLLYAGYASTQAIIGYTMPVLEGAAMDLTLRSYVPLVS